jgi:hypothetical protein
MEDGEGLNEDDVGVVCLNSMSSMSDGKWSKRQNVICCSMDGWPVKACVFRPM